MLLNERTAFLCDSICYGFMLRVFGGSSPELVDYSQGSVLSRLPELCTLHPLVCREFAVKANNCVSRRRS